MTTVTVFHDPTCHLHGGGSRPGPGGAWPLTFCPGPPVRAFFNVQFYTKTAVLNGFVQF